MELTEACARELAKRVPECDYILTAESKGIPLAYEMSRQLKVPYIVARKSVKGDVYKRQHGTSVAPLGLIAMKGAEELGNKLNDYLVNWAHKGGYDVDTFLIESECPRFSSGDGKGLIKSTVRGKDLFIIVDVGNYNVKYQMYDQMNACLLYTSPAAAGRQILSALCGIFV